MPALFPLAAAVRFTDGLQQAWDDVVSYAPKVAGSVVVLLVGWFVARVLRNVTVRLARRLRFDELVDRSGLGTWAERLGYDDAGLLLGRLVHTAALLLALQLAIDVLGDTRIQEALSSVVGFLPSLAVALVVIVVTGLVAGRVRELIAPTSRPASGVAAANGAGPASPPGGAASRELTAKGAAAAVWVVGIFAALNQLRVASAIVTTLFQAAVYTVGLILVIKFGVGGISSARDRFWPRVYDRVQGPLPPRQPAGPPRQPMPWPGPGYGPVPPGSYGAAWPPGAMPAGPGPGPGPAVARPQGQGPGGHWPAGGGTSGNPSGQPAGPFVGYPTAPYPPGYGASQPPARPQAPGPAGSASLTGHPGGPPMAQHRPSPVPQPGEGVSPVRAPNVAGTATTPTDPPPTPAGVGGFAAPAEPVVVPADAATTPRFPVPEPWQHPAGPPWPAPPLVPGATVEAPLVGMDAAFSLGGSPTPTGGPATLRPWEEMGSSGLPLGSDDDLA